MRSIIVGLGRQDEELVDSSNNTDSDAGFLQLREMMWKGWRVGRLRVVVQHSLSSYQFTAGTAMKRCMLAPTPTLALVFTSSNLTIPTPCGEARPSTTASITPGEAVILLSGFSQPLSAPAHPYPGTSIYLPKLNKTSSMWHSKFYCHL